jgi:hypothetical protein
MYVRCPAIEDEKEAMLGTDASNHSPTPVQQILGVDSCLAQQTRFSAYPR